MPPIDKIYEIWRASKDCVNFGYISTYTWQAIGIRVNRGHTLTFLNFDFESKMFFPQLFKQHSLELKHTTFCISWMKGLRWVYFPSCFVRFCGWKWAVIGPSDLGNDMSYRHQCFVLTHAVAEIWAKTWMWWVPPICFRLSWLLYAIMSIITIIYL